MAENDTHFLIGDVQGQNEPLTRLLRQEGLLSDEGKRLQPDVTVAQLGDLGHFARYHMGSQRIDPENDYACFKLLEDGIIDWMLWGNHDRPLMRHLRWDQIFGGYLAPSLEFIERIDALRKEGRIKLAHAAEGFLLTHAGLTPAWEDYNPDITDIEAIADALNAVDAFQFDGIGELDMNVAPFIDTIGYARGGDREYGGILWRDNNDEPLWEGARQIYGHSAYETIQAKETKAGTSYCIDISKADRIGGIWLPSETVATVDAFTSDGTGGNGHLFDLPSR